MLDIYELAYEMAAEIVSPNSIEFEELLEKFLNELEEYYEC